MALAWLNPFSARTIRRTPKKGNRFLWLLNNPWDAPVCEGNLMAKKRGDEDRDKFESAARALECDESEERFDAALRKIGRRKPPDKKPEHEQLEQKPAK
jgi:hypothetical protein